MIKPYVPGRSNLRSADKYLLTVPDSNLVSCGYRSFSVAAPKLWNCLPLNVKCASSIPHFEKELKAYLFRKAFEHFM